MALQHDLPQGFVKHVVRRTDLVIRAATNATKANATAKTSTAIERGQTSSLQAPVVAIMLGGFVGVFLLFVLIGITCKFANKPRADKRPTDYSKPMFQPSAAGYGSAAASYNPAYRGNASRGDVSNPYVGLLDSASPMGHGGRYEEGGMSGSSSSGNHANNGAMGGYPMMPTHSSSSFSGDESSQFVPSRGNGHTRGSSTGIEVPGPAAASAFRRNVSGSHPPVHSPTDGSYESPHMAIGMAPDGSGFSPGQVFDHGANNNGPSNRYSEMREARASRLGAPPSVMPRRASLLQNGVPQQKAFPRGPPASSKNRRSKYAHSQLGSSNDIAATRRSRIDSVGPGTYRKSMFLSHDQDPMSSSEFAGGSQSSRRIKQGGSPFGSHRRLESIGKGDPRRSSRIINNNNNNRASLIRPMAMAEEDETAYLPSMGGNGGAPNTQHSPYGSSNDSSSPLGPLGPNDPMLSMQQQQQAAAGGGVRMMPYGAGFGMPMPRPGVATTQISSPSSFAPAVPIGVGLGTRQIL